LRPQTRNNETNTKWRGLCEGEARLDNNSAKTREEKSEKDSINGNRLSHGDRAGSGFLRTASHDNTTNHSTTNDSTTNHP
jgi:hypothetical protein